MRKNKCKCCLFTFTDTQEDIISVKLIKIIGYTVIYKTKWFLKKKKVTKKNHVNDKLNKYYIYVRVGATVGNLVLWS